MKTRTEEFRPDTRLFLLLLHAILPIHKHKRGSARTLKYHGFEVMDIKLYFWGEREELLALKVTRGASAKLLGASVCWQSTEPWGKYSMENSCFLGPPTPQELLSLKE